VSNKLKVAFVGCSLTRGDGFDQADIDQTWPSIIADQFMFDADNLSISGASNYRIFMQVSQALQSQRYDIVFAQWTALNRLWLSPGPNVWYFTTGDGHDRFEYRDFQLDRHQKTQLTNTILSLNHDYQNIIDLIDYVKIAEDLAQLHTTKLINVNGLVPWQSDLADPLHNFETLSDYTCTMLDFDKRDDDQIHSLLLQLKNKFAELDTTSWINLFESFASFRVDVGPLGHHPGPKSQQIMADKIANFLEQRKL
jgi:hypothetical protein